MRRKNTPGCPCCGSSGVNCGFPCAACGGVRLVVGEGQVTDANGSVGFLYLSGPQSWITNRLLYAPGYLNFQDVFLCSGTPSAASLPYRYSFVCNSDGTISLFVYQIPGPLVDVPQFYICDGLTPGGCCEIYIRTGTLGTRPGYFTRSDGFGGGVQPFRSTVEPVCADGVLTADFTFDPLPGYGGLTIQPPSPTASLSIPIETPREQVCCAPCGIPKKDLVVSWTGAFPGSANLIFNGNSWASECSGGLRWTFGCPNSVGYPVLTVTRYSNASDCTGTTTSGTVAGQPVDFSCNPYHMHYLARYDVNSNACRILNNNTACTVSTPAINVYVDE